ncbi:sugar kinase [Alteromonas sediminis]|uniref:Sugar kinase n=1 Tax=Alteromonas sediminis TaxID=2259342 RepID=A0A3N5ZBH6_9ALTE|nr:sugar kinase [Alteromonas sediminis]RPJ68674.1 sugar kinase [Alteromonas sediminis]
MLVDKSAPTLVAVGECMAELSFIAENNLSLSFAGDTYNALVYAKRCCSELNAVFFTGIGQDALSQRMQQHWKDEGVDGTSAVQISQHNAGIYLIQNDQSGERYFDYWRENSAARHMFTNPNIVFPNANMVIFSGISMGILPDDDKARLLCTLEEKQQQGAQIVFDPNYRAAMWNGLKEAQYWMNKAYELCDLALPGIDDHLAIFNHSTVDDIVNYLGEKGVEEAVIKAGKQGVYGVFNGTLACHSEFKPAPIQVDSTAAGDAFAGGYLSARLCNQSQAESIEQAEDVARLVVQHKGAIIAKSVFEHYNSTVTHTNL